MIISKKIYFSFIILIFSIAAPGAPGTDDDMQLWNDCHLNGVISYNIFRTAMNGYRKLDTVKKKNLLTIVDYSKPSTDRRFFVIDIEKKQLLYKCLVAHGKNSGDLYAEKFSNSPETLKSSLGFFITGEIYYGRHGIALRLDGREKGINDNARMREIVIHGADYVSDEFIRKYGRAGLSWGCPALPVDVTKDIVSLICDGSCLFIYANDKYYQEHTAFPSAP